MFSFQTTYYNIVMFAVLLQVIYPVFKNVYLPFFSIADCNLFTSLSMCCISGFY